MRDFSKKHDISTGFEREVSINRDLTRKYVTSICFYWEVFY